MLGCIGRKCSGDGSGVSSNINWILNGKPIGVFWRAIIWKRSVSTAGCAVIVALSSWPFLVANFITNCAVSRDNDSDFSTGDYRPKGLWCTILFYWCCYRSPDHSTWLTGRGLTGWARSAPRVLRHQSKKRPICDEFLSRSRFLLKQFREEAVTVVRPSCYIY